ncbi:MAG: hypothetical protein RL701_2010 [Pseudomonadota bacterium]
MSLNDLKADFGQAYVRAISHAAGFFVQEANRAMDADGVDLTLFARGAGGTVRSPRLELQLKTTASIASLSAGAEDLPFDLEIKNYDELRSEDVQVPRILVVVSVPQDIADWVKSSEQELTLQHCGYWTTLRGAAPVTNATTKRVHLKRSNCFHVAQVQSLMQRLRAGELP